jgi:hypothetical protein
MIIYTIIIFSRKEKSNNLSVNEQDNEQTLDLLLRLLKELNCQPELEEEEDKVILDFDFQGGHFRMNVFTDSPHIKLTFPFVFKTAIENIDLIRHLCNQLNKFLRISKYVYSIDEKENCTYVHILTGYMLLEISYIKKHLKELLITNFELERLFISQFDELNRKSGNSENKDIEKDHFEKVRELFLLREQEFTHQQKNWQWRLNETTVLTLGQFLDSAFNMQDVILSRLTLITQEMHVITDSTEISAFDLLNPMIAISINKEFSFAHKNITLIVEYTQLQGKDKNIDIPIILNLHAEGETKQSLYVRVIASKPPLCINRNISIIDIENQVKVCSVLVAFDKQPIEQKQAEFEYMWQEAQEKVNAGKRNELTEEQHLICDCIHPNIAYNLYWGKVLFQDNRYYEALLHLENAYYSLQGSFHSMHNLYKENFYEICYLIGFSYCELYQYQRAYYFLDIVFNQTSRITYTMEYINCLANSKDFRTIGVIDSLLNNIQLNEEEEKMTNPALISFIDFLRRRKGYAYIDIGQLDDAENIFKSMLDEPNNHDYALDELAYIQQLKNRSQQ